MSGKNKIKIPSLLLLVSFGLLGFILVGQKTGSKYRVMFYNVENLFDTQDDSLTRDGEFLPEADKHWTKKRFWTKINKTSKVIMAIGGYQPPEIIGLCEVENLYVLKMLVQRTNLSKYPYRIVHQNSPDLRGIDVALLYREDRVRKLESAFIPIHFPDSPDKRTRDIVYLKALCGKDTVHFFVNHWPSRYGGQKKSEASRMVVAKILRNKIDSLLQLSSRTNIIVMGDFNDTPKNISIKKYLNAKMVHEEISENTLVNLTATQEPEGTISYRGQWYSFDQIMVSYNLWLKDLPKVHSEMHIFSPKWLLEEETKFPGSKPYRTYYGPAYHGGFSDHLPVYIDVLVNQ